MGFEIRVPRAMMPGRLWPAGARPLRDPQSTTGGRDKTDRRRQSSPRDEDVELAVRERLYGTRRHAR